MSRKTQVCEMQDLCNVLLKFYKLKYYVRKPPFPIPTSHITHTATHYLPLKKTKQNKIKQKFLTTHYINVLCMPL